MSKFNEPWKADYKKWSGYEIETRILDATESIVLTDGMDYGDGTFEYPQIPYDEKLRRIVACVNFLEGIDTVMLERFVENRANNSDGFPLKDCRRYIELWAAANPHVFGDNDVWEDPWKDGTP